MHGQISGSGSAWTVVCLHILLVEAGNGTSRNGGPRSYVKVLCHHVRALRLMRAWVIGCMRVQI